MKKSIVIGTRGSKLALWQAEHIAGRIRERFPAIEVTLKKIVTTGDKILDVPLAKIGGKGLFTKELENAMLSGDIDLAVHSLKHASPAARAFLKTAKALAATLRKP